MTERLKSVDFVRSLAIVCMIQAHIKEYCIARPNELGSCLHRGLVEPLGGYAAPLFTLVSGLSTYFAVQSHSRPMPWDRAPGLLKRGVALFLLSTAVNVAAGPVLKVIDISMLNWSVVQLIGFCLCLVPVYARLRWSFRLLWTAIPLIWPKCDYALSPEWFFARCMNGNRPYGKHIVSVPKSDSHRPMNICLIGDFSDNLDEGYKNTTTCLARGLEKDNTVIRLNVKRLGTVKSWRSLLKVRPQIIHTIAQPTHQSLVLTRLLGLAWPHARTVISALRPEAYFAGGKVSRIQRWLTYLTRPNLVLVQHSEARGLFEQLGCLAAHLPNGVDLERFRPVSEERKRQLALGL